MAGVVEGQREAGVPIPGGRAVEDWVRPIVERQIKVHEERCAAGVPGPPATPPVERDTESPARISRGDVGEDTVAIERPLDSREWREAQTAPRGRRHVEGRPDTRPLELRLLEARARLLFGLPEWERRLVQVADDAVAIARRNGFAADIPRTQELQATLMMGVIEDSTRIFGDWRTPAARGPTRQYYLTPTGLVPVGGPPKVG